MKNRNDARNTASCLVPVGTFQRDSLNLKTRVKAAAERNIFQAAVVRERESKHVSPAANARQWEREHVTLLLTVCSSWFVRNGVDSGRKWAKLLASMTDGVKS